MKEYIEREAFIDAMHGDYRDVELAQNFPAADVRPVVRGRKEKAQQQPYFRGHFPTFVCSECHREVNKQWNYCPNCGAWMDGGVNDGT